MFKLISKIEVASGKCMVYHIGGKHKEMPVGISMS